MAYDKDKLRKKFPNLAAELNEESMKVSIDSVRTEAAVNDSIPSSKSASYFTVLLHEVNNF